MLVALVPPLELGITAIPLVGGLGLLQERFTWPWHLLIPLVIAAIAALFWKPDARLALGWQSGDASGKLWLAAVAIAVLASIALVTWAAVFRPELETFRAIVPRGDTPVLISAALGFALLNATMEELIWRGESNLGWSATPAAGWPS